MSYYGKVLEELLVGKYQLLLLLFKNKYCFKSFKTQAVCNLHFVPGYPFNPTKIWGASYVQGARRDVSKCRQGPTVCKAGAGTPVRDINPCHPDTWT